MENSRRRFLVRSATGLGTAWALTNWPAVLAAQQHAHAVAGSGQSKLAFFSPEQAAELEAMTAQIIPADESPGAKEARVLYFIDRALTTFDRDRQPAYAQGLKELTAHVSTMFPGQTKFSSLTGEQQIQLLTSIETTDFFEQVRVHTIMGFLSDPSHGGNFEEAGWKLIGFESNAIHQRPFGYYDAEAAGVNPKDK